MYQMIKKSVNQKIKEYFFKNPTSKLRIREIERNVKISLPSAISQTKELVKKGILKRTEISNITLFSANRASHAYLLEKRLFNIKELFDLGLIGKIKANYGKNCPIILFGSYFKGEDIEESDIDIYVQTTKNKIAFPEIEVKLKRKIQMFIYKNLKSIKNKDLANNILNGIVLNGYIEVL